MAETVLGAGDRVACLTKHTADGLGWLRSGDGAVIGVPDEQWGRP